jgi:signal transduction histidine kinase
MPYVGAPQPRPEATSTDGEPSRDALQLIAEGVTALAGVGVAVISVARDDGTLEVMAVAGDEKAREQMVSSRTPLRVLHEEMSRADDWGLLKFVPHERVMDSLEDYGWVPDLVPDDAEDAWHPYDMLFAPLLDDEGVLRGLLSVDLPENGRRPGMEQRRVITKYAEQARRAVVMLEARERLAEQVRLAYAARDVVRTASAHASVAELLDQTADVLVQGFDARGLWLQVLGGEAILTRVRNGEELPPVVQSLATDAARRLWEGQKVGLVTPDSAASDLTDDEVALVRETLEHLGVRSLIFAPVGAGREVLGYLGVTRTADQAEWSQAEMDAVRDIALDLGRAIITTRTSEKERQLVQELQTLDSYKSQLIATVSHELKSPLTSVLGHLELVESDPTLSERGQASVAAMQRGTHRLTTIIDDLLTLSEVADHPLVTMAVDLAAVADDVIDLHSVSASQRGVVIRLDRALDDPVVARGDQHLLDRVLGNLVGNAVKYSPDGGEVVVSLATRGPDQVEMSVRDQGLGISEADREALFTEFFRSTNPRALAEPGTGLGLTICARIVARHGGRIEVDSRIGRGSTFRVLLPAAAAGSTRGGWGEHENVLQ